MNTMKYIEEMGLLAELSYVDFRDISLLKNNSGWKINANQDIDSEDNQKAGRVDTLQKLLNTYEIVDFIDHGALLEGNLNIGSGLQMLLLKSGNNYVIAYRGTGGLHDGVITDVAEMGLKLMDNAQFKESLEQTQKWIDSVKASNSNATFTLTGHSLGGALAQLNSYVYGFETYTINAFGFDAATAGGVVNMQAVLTNIGYRNMGVQNTSNIYNFIAEGGLWQDFISGGLTDLVGAFQKTHNGQVIIIKDNTGGYVGLLGSHSSIDINNSLAIYHNLMQKFNIRTYDFLSNLINDVQIYPENQVVETLNIMAKAMGIALSNDHVKLSESIQSAWQGSNLSLTRLAPLSAASIATQAKSDSAVLYALAKLNPFAIEGNLPAYANLNRTDMSDKYIEDRAQYLYYLLDKAHRYDVDPTLSMTWYEDAALGSDYTLEQTFSRSRVLFGGEGKSTLTGGDNGDHLYGMGGDDTLTGNGGDDYMEGGIGYDTYYSGNGDTIKDSDGSGKVAFEGKLLHGGVAQEGECKPDGSGEYKGDGGVYKLSGGKLTFTKDGTGEILTIEKFYNGDLGISLTSKDPGASCPPPPPRQPEPSPAIPNPNFSSPLILDLNGDGVTSTFISSTSTYFDLDNDGVRQRTGWVQGEDGILVFDKNRDGKVNNGTELFGNHTLLKNGTKAANGFEALREYDENKDGVIDAKDNIYNTLKLWQDGNSDGVTDTGELHTLTELGVKSINLDYIQTTDYEEQNRIFQTSTFTTTDGTTQSINDVWFATESRDTARDTTLTLKDSVAALPDFRGAGRVANLSTAMNNNTKLETAVTTLLTKSTTSTYDSLLGDVKNILALWTKTDNISATATRGVQYIMNHNYTNAQPISRYQVYAYARDVAILETFWGQNFTMNVDGKTTSDVIGTEMSNYMTNSITTLTDTVLATLLVQQLYGKDAYDVTAGQFDNKINPVNSIIKSKIHQKAA
jgi:hypothetical protein